MQVITQVLLQAVALHFCSSSVNLKRYGHAMQIDLLLGITSGVPQQNISLTVSSQLRPSNNLSTHISVSYTHLTLPTNREV